GDDPAALVADLDARREEARARRHAGDDVPLPDVPDRITFRDAAPGRWVHVPTGLPLGAPAERDARLALLAALVRLPSTAAQPTETPPSPPDATST
ncbi:MAG: hypothetical protein MUF34_37400, partial [Polyangiaceae bacterium]|nr:hypothetical protein [Polyangiaceae bacterium]